MKPLTRDSETKISGGASASPYFRMVFMSILALIKKLLRISTDALDDVITLNINACIQDMNDQGINTDTEDDKLVKAVELYCKWQMNHNGEADRYERNYTQLINTMSEQESHRIGDETDEG